MTLALLAGTILAQNPTVNSAPGIVIDTKGIEMVRSYKEPFELKPGTKTFQTYFHAKIPSGLGIPIPVGIQYGCFLPGTNTPAPKLEVMYLSIHSDNATVYNSYNLQKVDQKNFKFNCKTKANLAEFSLSRESGFYDVKGTISTMAHRVMYDMKPTWQKNGESWETSLPLTQALEILVAANIKFKVGNTEPFVPSIITVRRGSQVIYQKEAGKHTFAIRVAPEATGETSRIFLGIKPKQNMGSSMKAEFKAIGYVPFKAPTWN